MWLAGLLLAAHAGAQESKPDKAEILDGFEEARKALVGFLDAKTFEEATNYVLDAEHLQARREALNQTNPWQPVEAVAIRYGGGSRVKGKTDYYVHDFELVVKGRGLAIPVTMVQDGDQYKVDWELFSQAHDDTFEIFLEDQPAEPGTFRLTMHRGVLLDEDADLPLSGEVVRARAGWRPGIEFPASLYASSESDAGKAMSDEVPWQNAKPFRVTLRWNKEGARPFLEVLELDAIDFMTPSVFGDAAAE